MGATSVKFVLNDSDELPALRLRMHKTQKSYINDVHHSGNYTDMRIEESADTNVAGEASQ